MRETAEAYLGTTVEDAAVMVPAFSTTPNVTRRCMLV